MTTNELHSVLRRDVLKTIGLGTAIGVVGFTTMSGRARAVSTETLYLTDSGGDNGGSFLTKLYSVELDSGTGQANLTLLKEITDSDFDQVDAIAASADGLTIYMVDKNSKHLGTYDVSSGTFTDEGVITGLPGGVVLASFAPSGELYVASQNDNGLYTVDPSGPTATQEVTLTGVNVQGADIAFDSNGTLFLYSSGSQELYTVDYDSSSSTFGAATFVGKTGDFFTGLAVRSNGSGDLVGSNTTRDEIVVVDKSTGAQGQAFELYLGGTRYAYGFGDMTLGTLEAACEACDSGELLAKYEFACVETEIVDDEEVCVRWEFVPENGELDEGISYTEGAFSSKPDTEFEPMSVSFDTEYCDVYALVKSGQEFEVQSFEDNGGSITVETANDEKYAISFVAFYCTEDAANAALEAFLSKGKPN